MNRTSLMICLAATMVASVGCSSKKYVREQTAPLINKTNELDDLTAKNSKDIKDVDSRAQAGISQVQAKASEVDQKAQTAAQQAGQAQTVADGAVKRVDVLTNTVANLDNQSIVTTAGGFATVNISYPASRAFATVGVMSDLWPAIVAPEPSRTV